jgi:transmembrane sensor
MSNDTRAGHSPLPNRAPDWEALARYLAGECDSTEALRIRRQLGERPLDATLIAALDRASKLAGVDDAGLDVERALQRVNARRAEPVVRPLVPRSARIVGRPARQWSIASVAALAASVIATVGVIRWMTTRQAGRHGTTGTPAQTLSTAIGERDSLRLSDGTRIVIGPASRIDVAAGYGRSQREVTVRGQTFFDVVHDAARPFVVHAGTAAIRDVGTTFTVQADRADSIVVAVTAGSVVLHAAATTQDRDVVLRAGDAGVLRGDGTPVVRRGTVSDDDVAWTRGLLVFRETPFDQVQRDLRRWYGVELRAADSSLVHGHLTATFADERIDGIQTVLQLALGAEIERHGDTLVVVGARRGARPR